MHTVGNGEEVVPRAEAFGIVRSRFSLAKLLNPDYQSHDAGQDFYRAHTLPAGLPT